VNGERNPQINSAIVKVGAQTEELMRIVAPMRRHDSKDVQDQDDTCAHHVQLK
jgi:hypothetical protein